MAEGRERDEDDVGAAAAPLPHTGREPDARRDGRDAQALRAAHAEAQVRTGVRRGAAARPSYGAWRSRRPWIASTGTGRAGRQPPFGAYTPATVATAANRSARSQAARSVMAPPLEMPVA